MLYEKYGTQTVVSKQNITLGFASCYICLSPTLSLAIFLNQACAWFLRIASVHECLYPHVCVHVSAPEAINNWWRDIDPV